MGALSEQINVPPELDRRVPLDGEQDQKTIRTEVLGDVLALFLMVSMSLGMGVGVGAWTGHWGAGVATACLPNWIVGVFLAFRN